MHEPLLGIPEPIHPTRQSGAIVVMMDAPVKPASRRLHGSFSASGVTA